LQAETKGELNWGQRHYAFASHRETSRFVFLQVVCDSRFASATGFRVARAATTPTWKRGHIPGRLQVGGKPLNRLNPATACHCISPTPPR
jgi:hypothetical protein